MLRLSLLAAMTVLSLASTQPTMKGFTSTSVEGEYAMVKPQGDKYITPAEVREALGRLKITNAEGIIQTSTSVVLGATDGKGLVYLIVVSFEENNPKLITHLEIRKFEVPEQGEGPVKDM